MLALALALAAAAPASSSSTAALAPPEDEARVWATSLRSEESPALRAEAARRLGFPGAGGEEGLESLGRAALDDPSLPVRKAAALALAARGGPGGLGRLQEFLASERSASLRAAACAALGQSAPQSAWAVAGLLAEALALDTSPLVRLAAVGALAALKEPRSLPAARRAAASDKDPDVRREARALEEALLRAMRKRPRRSREAAPDPSALKGVDFCGQGNGWCECSNGPLRPPPRCMPLADCRHALESAYRPLGYACSWDGRPLE